MIEFTFTKQAKKQFLKLSVNQQKRLAVKLTEFKTSPLFFSSLKPLKNSRSATHRLRVGRFRLLLCTRTPDLQSFFILKLAHRRDIYK